MTDSTFAPPAIAFGPRWPSQLTAVRDQVLESAKDFPDHAAIEEAGVITTYADLDARSRSLAAWLAHNHELARSQSIVAVVGGRSANLITAMLSTWRVGASYLPIASDYPIERIRYLIEDAKPTAVLVDRATTEPALVEEILQNPHAICIDDMLAANLEIDEANLDPNLQPQRMAYVIYTSGSTGKPKGSILTHRNISNFCAAHSVDVTLTTLDRMGWSGNVAFDASASDVWPALCGGATICIAPPRANENLRVLLKWLADDRVTVQFGPTAIVNMLLGLEDEWWHGLSLRVMFTGGDRLVRRPPEGLPFTLINVYGPTECTIWVTASAPRSVPSRGGLEAPEIGYPIANTFITILDENLRQCVVGEQGELCIGGANVGRGYLYRPELTAEKFVHDHWVDSPGNGVVYRTGDQAIMRPTGAIQFVGRADRQIALQGFRIEAGEVESILSGDPIVYEAVVKRHDYPALGPRLIAFITLVDGANSATPIDDIRERMRTKAPAYMIPNQFVILSEMPMTPHGKVDEKALTPPSRTREGLVAAGLLSAAFEPPTTAAQQRTCDIFADVLGMDTVGLDDSFFDLGGDSLAGVAAMAKMESSFETELAADALQGSPTAREMAATLRGEGSRAPVSRDWVAESVCEMPVVPLRVIRESAAIMVTGAGGFVGSELVRSVLAADENATVNALVRSESSGEKLLASLGHSADRVSIVVGDLTKRNLGMSPDVIRQYQDNTRAVIHAGAEVNHFKTYEALREANVEATTRLARLAMIAGGGAVPFIYISTGSVDDIPSDDSIVNGYVRGKWVSERRLANAAEQGLPVRIIRLGRAVPRLDGGAFNMDDTLLVFFAACLKTGNTPDWRFTEGGHPIDVATDAIATVALQPNPEPGMQIWYPPMALWSSAKFLAAVDGHRSLKRVSWGAWVAALRADGSLTCQRALALVSANAGDDLVAGNYDAVSAQLAKLTNMLPSEWHTFNDDYYRMMAAELITATRE